MLKFPKLFDQYDLLDETLLKVTDDDIKDFIMARNENINHLTMFVQQYEKVNGKSLKKFKDILKRAEKIKSEQKKLAIDPVKIIQLIKLGDLGKIKEYFESKDNYLFLELLN